MSSNLSPNFNNSFEYRCFDARNGVAGEAGDDGLDENPCAVLGRLYDNALVVVITRILPLRLDADTVTDAECRVLVMG